VFCEGQGSGEDISNSKGIGVGISYIELRHSCGYGERLNEIVQRRREICDDEEEAQAGLLAIKI
jgi:hypothetical protein